MVLRTLGVAFAICLSISASAQDVRGLPPGTKSPPARIEMFSWMTGRWTGTGLGGELEEVYSPPRDGVMLAHFAAYDAKNGVEFMEFISIAERDGSLVLRIRHFNPDMTAWEEKDKWVEFPFVGREGDKFYFDGLTIERVGANEVIHYIRLKNATGQLRDVQTHYFRVPKK
jgi:hypothetical protein